MSLEHHFTHCPSSVTTRPLRNPDTSLPHPYTMTRTVPLIRESVNRPAKGSVDLFNVLDFEPPKEKDSATATSSNSSDDNDDLTGQELMEFYRDSVLLITGGTGFLGRILLQKLLRTFPVKRIYLLVRKKNTQSVEQRMDDFYQDVVRVLTLPLLSNKVLDPVVRSQFRSLTRCEPSVPTSGRR